MTSNKSSRVARLAKLNSLLLQRTAIFQLSVTADSTLVKYTQSGQDVRTGT